MQNKSNQVLTNQNWISNANTKIKGGYCRPRFINNLLKGHKTMINNNNNSNLRIEYNTTLFNAPNMKALSEFTRLDILQAAKSFGFHFHDLHFVINDATDKEFTETMKILELLTYNYNKPLTYVLRNFVNCCSDYLRYKINCGCEKLDFYTEFYFADLIKAEKEAEKKRKQQAAKYAKMQAEKIKAELTACLSTQNKKRVNNLLKYQQLINESLLDI